MHCLCGFSQIWLKCKFFSQCVMQVLMILRIKIQWKILWSLFWAVAQKLIFVILKYNECAGFCDSSKKRKTDCFYHWSHPPVCVCVLVVLFTCMKMHIQVLLYISLNYKVVSRTQLDFAHWRVTTWGKKAE